MPAYRRLLREVLQTVHAADSVQALFCVSGIHTGLPALRDAVADLERKSGMFFYESAELLDQTAEPKFRLMSADTFSGYYRHFRANVPEADIFQEQMNRMCSEIEAQQFEPSMVRKLFRAFDSYLKREIICLGCESSELFLADMSFRFCKDALFLQYQRLQASWETLEAVSSNDDINRVLRYIAENLDQKISLQSAADYIYKNSSYLSRLFKQHIGMSFTDYLIKQRIKKATQLLSNSDLSAEEIGERIGIDNVSYFYQFYKRETGKTPRSGREDEKDG